VNAQDSLDGKLTLVANRLRFGQSRGSTRKRPATSNRQPTHSQQSTINPRQPGHTILVFFWCICVALFTITGCAAERGTIGAQLGKRDDGRLFIRETPPGLAAQRAGLRPGDEITLINGQDVRAFDEKGIHRLLSGEVGDPVKLTVLRGEQVLHITLQRTPAPRPRKVGSKPE
jgi:membrane-associated protease RseP (regulator of RpoE activity)